MEASQVQDRPDPRPEELRDLHLDFFLNPPYRESAGSLSQTRTFFETRFVNSREFAGMVLAHNFLKGAAMPGKETLERAQQDKREGKSPSTQAGEFVREEIEHVREGKHGARSTKQAIAIGLSKARRAGVDLQRPKQGSKKVKEQAKRDLRKGKKRGKKKSAKRARATRAALKREPHRAASKLALSRQAKKAAKKRSAKSRSQAAKKAARTRKKT